MEKLKYTVADADVARINYSYHPDLFIETEISLQQRIAWALNSETPELKKAVDDWLITLKRLLIIRPFTIDILNTLNRREREL